MSKLIINYGDRQAIIDRELSRDLGLRLLPLGLSQLPPRDGDPWRLSKEGERIRTRLQCGASGHGETFEVAGGHVLGLGPERAAGRPIVITLHVDAATAVRECHSTAGPHRLELFAADVESLTEQQRETLARHIARAPGWGDPLSAGAEPIGHASLEVLRALLDRRWETMSNAPTAELAPVGEWSCDCKGNASDA